MKSRNEIRKGSRKELVTLRDYSYGAQSAYWYSADYDLIGRPTNATDSVSLMREWLYNNRSELAAATIGINHYGYEYDTIGNRLWSAANLATNTYGANSLNQYTTVGRAAPSAPQTSLLYDADGNMTRDGNYSYSYDAENRLRAVTSRSMTNGALRVLNAYDHSNRRIRKIVQRLHSTSAPPPAQPSGTDEWLTLETHTFVWDGNNIVLEKVDFADGTSRTFENFWGLDKSGTEQGAGGVEGLLALSMDGVFYIPCYDHNGNIVLYVSETGTFAAQCTYDPYGNIIESSGPLADVFSFGFSTKYHDRETGMVGYKRRFYRPDLGRWLNRDPLGVYGGLNLYGYCDNRTYLWDSLGLVAFIPKWVGDGVVNDGNNLWIAIWLWPEDPPEKGIIISELKIEKSTLTDCQGNDLKNSPWADYVVTKNSFLKKDFLKSDQQKNGAVFKASGQDKFDSGLYFSLVDTKFKAGFKGANLKNCQKGEITMTFKYSLRRMLSDDEEDYFNEPKPLTSHESDISFPFDPEISHKPYSLYPVDFDFSETISISAKWDWCGGKEKVIIKTSLPNGPQRYGRSSKEW